MPSGVGHAALSGLAGAVALGPLPGDACEIGDHCGAADRLVDAQRLQPLAEHSAALRTRCGCLRQACRPGAPMLADRASCRRSARLPAAVVVGAPVAGLDDPRLQLAGDQAVQDAAFGFDRLELVPGRFAKAIGRGSRRCRSRRSGSATKSIWLSSARISCVLRAIRRAKASGRPCAMRVRQHRDRIGAAGGRREAGDRGAQDVGLRVHRRHHAIGCLGMDARLATAGSSRPPGTRAHSMRSARSLAIDRNWSWSTAIEKPICGAA